MKPDFIAGTTRLQKTALAVAVALLFLCLGLNFREITADRNGVLLLVVGGVFSAMVLLREKRSPVTIEIPPGVLGAGGLTGLALVLFGLIFDVHQFEWLGILLTLLVCLEYALPLSYSADAAMAVFIFYWIHPLPGNLLGRLQIFMQRLSVEGAERLLHAAKFPAWADGTILRTATRLFEVPAECSGMRTLMVVLLCTFGSGFLFRFRWCEMLGLAILSLVQVLGLNILRIATMAAYAGREPAGWATGFLHDTAGAYLLAAIALVQIEAALWRRWVLLPDDAAIERHAQGSRSAHVLAVLAAAAAGAMLLVLIFKRDASHRAAMIATVAEMMMEEDGAGAERALKTVRALDPGNRAYEILRIRALLYQRKYEAGLSALAGLPPDSRDESIPLLKAWGFVGAQRSREALSMLLSLPPWQRNQPGIAMTAAEVGAGLDELETVIRGVRMASPYPGMTERIRQLFAYLARRGEWEVIAGADRDLPYRDPMQMDLALAACVTVNEWGRAAEILKKNREIWRGQPRFLAHLLTMAVHQPEGRWTEEFAASFQDTLGQMTSDEITGFFEGCFRLGRPDLAWLGYTRLQHIAPGHPALALVPGLFAERWLTFRKRHIGYRMAGPNETADIRAVLCLLARYGAGEGFTRRIPLWREMECGPLSVVRSNYAARGLAEVERLRDREPPSYPVYVLYLSALDREGRLAESLAAVDFLESRHPERRGELLLRRARLRERMGQWQELYETARDLVALPQRSSASELFLVQALMRTDLGLYALQRAMRASERFPTSRELRAALAAVWESFGHDEEAYFVLTRDSALKPSLMLFRLEAKTGRLSEASAAARGGGPGPVAADLKRSDLLALPAAERAVGWATGPPPSGDSSSRRIADLGAKIAGDTSPFIRALDTLELEWWRSGGAGAVADSARWQAIGRDDMERAVAVHKLAMLEAGQGRREKALDAVGVALRFAPDSPILWRLRIALASGEEGVVKNAYRACPRDSEIWLAQLITGTGSRPAGFNPEAVVREASAGRMFSVGTFVRAGDFLLRSGERAAALEAARYAVLWAAGLTPAYALGVQTGVAAGDRKWTLACARKGAAFGLDPAPFLRTVVRLVMAEDPHAYGVVSALETLVNRYPKEREWRERLGSVRFHNGLMVEAWEAFQPLADGTMDGIRPAVLLLMAESARQCGRPHDSLRILRHGHELSPRNTALLNNLVHGLAQSSDTIEEARGLLPALLAAGATPSICDTAAAVFFRLRDMPQTEAYLKRALEGLSAGDPHWREIHLHAAEIKCALGQYARAENLLKAMEKVPPKAFSPDDEERITAVREKLRRR